MSPEDPSARLGVLISGRGSNLEALAAACRAGLLPARVELVLSNRAAAPGLERAQVYGIPTEIVSPRGYADRATYDAALVDRLRRRGVEWVCLAGFMRLLSPAFLDAFPGRVVNIHPSLLPAFPGLDAQAQALAYGVKVTGCTVHLVDGGLDSGPIVAQSAVDLLEDDTVETLSARILEAEHRTYVLAMRRLLAGDWRLEGRRVVSGHFPPDSADQGVDTPKRVV